MYRFLSLYNKIRSFDYYNKNNYDKSLKFARRSALNYLRSGKVFNDKALEYHLLSISEKIAKKHDLNIKTAISSNNVGILATTLYDVGGHSECLMRFAESFHEEYKLHSFFTNLRDDTRRVAPKKYSRLKDISLPYELDTSQCDYEFKVAELLSNIINSGVKIIFVYIHMEDVVAASVLAYLNKYTDIKIIFFNHGDHTFSLGFEFNDLIIELRRQGQYITQKYRKKMQTALIPLQGTKKEDLQEFPKEEIINKRKEFGVDENNLVSLSGTSSYKIFKKNKSPYFEFIKKLLSKEPKLKHILISELNEKQMNIVKRIFKNDSNLLDRLIILKRQAEFDLLLQVGDVFIDSFPLGSALSHIDVIKNKRPTIIKKNKENEIYTFYNYLYDDYEYAFENIDEMVEKTLYLLNNKDEQQKIIEKVYEHYLNTYEFDNIKNRYKEIIENSDDLIKFYNKLPDDYRCNIKL